MKKRIISPILLMALLYVTSLKAQFFELDTNFSSATRDSRSANWADINNDGLLDIFITNGKSGGENNEAYINNGNGTFTNLTSTPIVQDNSSSDGASWADTDGIPGLELFVANWHNQKNLYYRDTNQTGLVSINNAHPTLNNSYSETGAFGDFDQDGFVDLIVTNSAVNKRNGLFHNNGDGTFNRITNSPIYQAFSTSRGINWVDVDNDGDLDVYITNEINENNELYINDTSQFIRNTTASITQFNLNSMSSCWGDYDNDGDLDVFVSIYGANNKLFRNDGNLSFVEITSSPTVTDGGLSFSANWGDIDNDGDLDLVVGNAFSTGGRLTNFLYLNNGNGTFSKNTTDTVALHQGWTFGNAFGDYDKDGDLDLLNANCYNANQANQLFNNLSNQVATPNSWIVIEACGISSNHSAIGAKIKVKATINGQAVYQLREISSQSSYCGQNMLAAHFGLGNANSVDSIIVEWPNGLVESFGSTAINKYFKAVEGQGLTTDINQSNGAFNKLKIYPNPSNGMVYISNTQNIQSIRIYSLQGQLIRNIKPTASQFELPEQTGMYIIQVEDKKGNVVSKKLMKD